MPSGPYVEFAVALGLGLIVGLQREWSGKRVAGVRTVTLVTLLGAACGLLAPGPAGGLIVVAGLAAVTVLFVLSNRLLLAEGGSRPGIATEIAGLLMYVVGALCTSGFLEFAVVMTGVIAVLLQWKRPLHRLVHSVGEDEVRALTRLVLVGMVILPVLPDRPFGPSGVLNPFRIWLMVVLIVGISLAAWVVQRMLGPRTGTAVAGVLGGLISSTATTAAQARAVGSARTAGGGGDPAVEAAAAHRRTAMAAAVVMIASAVVFVRVLVEILVVAPSILPQVAPPLLAMGAAMGVVAIVALLLVGRTATGAGDAVAVADAASPPSLASAVAFGAVYALVLLAVALVREHVGEGALFAVAILSGLTDMDAITLSSAELMKAGRLPVDTGWRLVLAGAMANIAFKGVVAASLGGRRLARRLGWMFGATLIAGGLVLAFWPA